MSAIRPPIPTAHADLHYVQAALLQMQRQWADAQADLDHLTRQYLKLSQQVTDLRDEITALKQQART